MAGVRIEVKDREVLAVLDELADRIANIDEPLRDIGEHLLNTTRERFDRQVAPDGTPWAPLNPAYRARKKKNADKILVLDGYLYGLLRYQVSDSELELGTDRVYGATHQLGDPERNIPARPYLGISDTDREDVLDILREYLEEAAH